jgi:hypothetical protein
VPAQSACISNYNGSRGGKGRERCTHTVRTGWAAGRRRAGRRIRRGHQRPKSTEWGVGRADWWCELMKQRSEERISGANQWGGGWRSELRRKSMDAADVEQQKGVGAAGRSSSSPESGAASALFPSHLTSVSVPIYRLVCCRGWSWGIGGQFPAHAPLPLVSCTRPTCRDLFPAARCRILLLQRLPLTRRCLFGVRRRRTWLSRGGRDAAVQKPLGRLVDN